MVEEGQVSGVQVVEPELTIRRGQEAVLGRSPWQAKDAPQARHILGRMSCLVLTRPGWRDPALAPRETAAPRRVSQISESVR